MCGIAGIMGDLGRDAMTAALSAMLDAERERGPDDSGLELVSTGDRCVGLGSCRLAILDVSPAGHQPMVNPSTGDVLVYNGEIYNSPALRGDLAAQGYSFRGGSDTEVLLRAYEAWGIGCLDRLRGMFAFALWDARRQRLVLARDHLGIKPLYYSQLGGAGFVCASEVGAILASGVVSATIEPRAIAGYLAYGAVQEPLTVVRGVVALEPAAWLEVDGTGRVTGKGTYWTIPTADPGCRAAAVGELVAEGRRLLAQSVGRHLLSDVPVGVFLSAGLDSTAVLGLAAADTTAKIHAFTVSFPEAPELDEAPIARETAKRLGAVYHECPVEASTAAAWAQQGLLQMDQPAMDGLNTYIVSRAVRSEGLVVALSGQGGDEVFGGYDSFRRVPRWYRVLRWLRLVPPEARAALAGLVAVGQPNSASQKARDIARTGADLPALSLQYRRLIADGDLRRLGQCRSLPQLTKSYHLPEVDVEGCAVSDDPIATVRRLETAFYLENTLLRDADVFGMANSLEIRVPFLDRDLVEWAFRLPGPVFLPRRARSKYLLRHIGRDFYSPVLSAQPKRGFTLPLASWLRGPLRELADECLSTVKASGLLLPVGVDHLQQVFFRERGSAAWSRVWALVALGAWLRSHRVG